MCIRLFESDVTGNYFMYYFSKLKWHIWHFYPFLCAISAVLQKTYKCRSCRQSKEVATQFFQLSLTFLNGLCMAVNIIETRGQILHAILLLVIIIRNLYLFYPIFHYGSYCRAVSVTENFSIFGSIVESSFKSGYDDVRTAICQKLRGN